MKKFLKILLIIMGIIAALIMALVLFFVWASKQPQVKENYFESVETDKPLEQKYTNKGTYEVSYVEYDAGSEKIGQFKIWYPTEMRTLTLRIRLS